MRCTNCGNIISYQKAPQLTDCVICGNTLVPDVSDILEFGKFGITNEKRLSQIELAKDVETLLGGTGGTLLAEGGTGIGKSFAYLIPAFLSQGKRVVISTAKKTLQDQLFNKDIPYLIEKMGRNDVTYTLYKGKANYACWKLSAEVPKEDRKKFDSLIDTAKNNNAPADLSGWSGPTPEWWSKVTIENCVLNTSCPHFKYCKPKPRECNIVITNHHLTAIDIHKAPGMLFGPFNLLILDEAHQAGDAFRSAHTKHVGIKGLDILKNMVLNDSNVSTVIDESGIIAAKLLADQIETLKKSFLGLYSNAKKYSDSTGTVKISELSEPLEEFRAQTLDLSSKIFQIQEAVSRTRIESAYSSEKDVPEKLVVMLSRIQRIHRRIETLVEFTNNILYYSDSQPTDKPCYITTIDDSGIKVQPLDIGALVGPRLKEIPYKVLMSATLAVNKDFTYIKKQYGFTDDNSIVERIYLTPFDLKSQALMYIPQHLPLPKHEGDPQRSEWVSAISTEIAQLVGATKGGAFVLFSAKSDMLEVSEELKSTWDDLGLNLIVQEGDATATKNRFLAGNNNVLFGLKSFWEGIDIPGDDLRLVIIPKLPFPNTNDPIIAALKKAAGDNSFYDVMIPLMFFDMKQGVGRLIRTQTDKGFIAILDPRVWTSSIDPTKHSARLKTINLDPYKKRIGYGKDLLDTLGFTNVTHDFTVLKKFVNRFFNGR